MLGVRLLPPTPTDLAPTKEVLGTTPPGIAMRRFMLGSHLVADVLPEHCRSSGNISRNPETRCSHLFARAPSNILLLRGLRCIVVPVDPPWPDVAGFHFPTRLDVALASKAVTLAAGMTDWTQLSIVEFWLE